MSVLGLVDPASSQTLAQLHTSSSEGPNETLVDVHMLQKLLQESGVKPATSRIAAATTKTPSVLENQRDARGQCS